MKLYMHPGACSLSPHIVCRELGLPVELVEVDRQTHRTSSGADFFGINGNGYVPVLELDKETALTEGPAIVQYLADLKPHATLLPKAGTIERARVQSWLNFITSELHKPMVLMFRPGYASARSALFELVQKRLDWLATQIAGPYLSGETFTVADAYLFVVLNWSPWLEIDLGRWPALQAFRVAVGKRPKVQEALAAEGLAPFGEDEIFYAPPAMVDARKAARS
ncbi:MAG TPA: glutathione S-transferase N-terminal domain-containing protein [Dongiaceae bacterium]|jgi:glutathione S-transferase|nr:glutathione S-transferase N-terminal domain-containing protein [Dongiaceae bacterium]